MTANDGTDGAGCCQEECGEKRAPLRRSLCGGRFRGRVAGRVDQGIQIALEDSGEVVDVQADAVVGHPVLWEVVGADLLAAISGPNLAAARRHQLLLPLAVVEVLEAGAQDAHRLRPVLVLGLLVLAA